MQRPKAQVLIPRNQVAAAVDRLAAEIRRDYRDRPPLLVGVLKGSFMFLADLVRVLGLHVEIDFIRLSSYGSSTVSSGKIDIAQDVRAHIAGRDVLIIEDIVDTGHTIKFLRAHLAPRRPASVRLCTLLDKPSRRVVPITIDYCGFCVPDVFIVGYGIDWNEQFRYLPDICFLKEEECGPHRLDQSRQG
jgi:hypoxanthine phosphoribosyltransferase